MKEKSALEEHNQLHADALPLQCVLCKKVFKQKGALVRHMRIHVRFTCCQRIFAFFIHKWILILYYLFCFVLYPQSGLHFYQCHRCGKGFVHKSSFEMHLMAHDDIRKKQCPHCTQMFRSTSHLNRHLRIHVSAAETVFVFLFLSAFEFFHLNIVFVSIPLFLQFCRLVQSHIRVLYAVKNSHNAII